MRTKLLISLAVTFALATASAFALTIGQATWTQTASR
jgi:hypothetical protein